jgi:hypothetical protein
MNRRDRQFPRRLSSIERAQPGSHAFANSLDFNPSIHCGKRFEPSQSSAQQRCGALSVFSLKVVECRRNLNQSLKERFLRLVASQPDALPVFMRQKIFAALVAMQTFRQRSRTPVKRHQSLIAALSGTNCELRTKNCELVFLQHFVQQHAQVVGAGVSQPQIGRSGLRNLVGEI